ARSMSDSSAQACRASGAPVAGFRTSATPAPPSIHLPPTWFRQYSCMNNPSLPDNQKQTPSEIAANVFLAVLPDAVMGLRIIPASVLS
ncbi:MAG: hypothetical protein OXC72_13270, partial [Roseovarius sp.]|nr:hypothetical protein [Roseovarius sp.]